MMGSVRVVALMCALSAVCLTACTGKQVPQKPGPLDKATRAAPIANAGLRRARPAFYRHIPADSPLVLASYGPLSRGLFERLARVFEPLADELFEQAARDSGQDGLEEELRRVFSLDGLAEIGFSLTPRYAVYMVGPSLVVRIQLEDGAKLRGYVHELAEHMETPFPARTRNGYEFMTERDGALETVVAIADEELVIAVLTSAESAAVLPQVFAEAFPARNIVDSGLLDRLRLRYHFSGAGFGFIDTVALFNRMLDERRVLGLPSAKEAETRKCVQETRDLLQALPRLVVGVEELDSQVSFLYAAELGSAWAKALGEVLTSVPGVDALSEKHPQLVVGLGLDVAKAAQKIPARFEDSFGDGFACAELDGLNALSKKGWSRSLMVPQIRLLQGALVTADGIDFSNPGLDTASIALLLRSANTNALSSMLSMIAKTAPMIPPTGEVVEISVTSAMPVKQPLLAARTDKVFGVAAGARQSRFLADAVRERPVIDGPFGVLEFDLPDVLSAVPSDPEDTAELAGRRFLKLLGRVQLKVFTTEHGLLLKHVVDV